MLLGESENRLACILGSIPIFWPVVEDAAERIQGLYRVLITQEFSIGSSRALPGQAMYQNEHYEPPHWAEQSDKTGRAIFDNNDEREQEAFPNTSSSWLPRWPESTPRSPRGSEASLGS